MEVKVPDIGDFKDVAVIELMVKPGEVIAVDTGLIMVESDKASMEIPSSHAGTIKELNVKLGDKVSEGSVIADPGGATAFPPLPPGPARGAAPLTPTLSQRRAGGSAPQAGSYTGKADIDATCSCSARALAATRPRSAAPTSA